MELSRREFLAAGVSAAAMAYAGCGVKREGEDVLPGEDGSKLWLRYASGRRLGPLVVFGDAATSNIARAELAAVSGESGLALYAGGRDFPTAMARVFSQVLGDDGFQIRYGYVASKPAVVIRGNTDVAMLHGVFHFLRLVHTGAVLENLNVLERPRLQLRLVNHWDNLDGSIERGYAGKSLWNWAELPHKVSPRMLAYARANASIGINGTVLNNVNASATFLTGEYLAKAGALADAWRPYGLKVHLAINFSAPMVLDKLPTADPLDPGVASWWKRKAEEIYAVMPDFGGFLVKANSEGQPGPQDFGRTHAEGANMLADALMPHGGHVIWRAFIYDEDVDADRAKRAYIEFAKLDGKFRPNVLLQVKNGPIDFQPREPFHPLFGAMPATPVMAEVQATQEYLGQGKHLVYLGTMWEEFLRADTFAKGAGSTVAGVIGGEVHPYQITGAACVLNTGSDANWCGHEFSQANWYAFGRLAWDPSLSAAAIAEEWVRQTWTGEPVIVKTIVDMMMRSRETFVDYTMPLGLHHLIGGDHYAPMPWNAEAPRKDWTAVYYHQASKEGIGFDRTRSGDKAVEQYFPPVADLFDDVAKCPEKFLLWFHRVGWDYRMKSGRTLWEELCGHYQRGAADAAAMERTWAALAGLGIDARRHREVAQRLAIQRADAAAWRDKILAYFAGFSGRAVV